MDEDQLIVRLAENEDFYEGYSAGLFKAMNLEKLAKNSCELNDDRSAASPSEGLKDITYRLARIDTEWDQRHTTTPIHKAPDRSDAVIGLLFAAFSGAFVGWIAHIIMVAIRG